MADIADIAQMHMEQHPIVPQNDFNKPSRTQYSECDGEIPEQRRTIGGVTRCVDCQEEKEGAGI